MSSLANAKSSVGPKFRTVIILYMITTLAAAIVAVIMSFTFLSLLRLPMPAMRKMPHRPASAKSF